MGDTLVTALSELAARVQRGRTQDDVLGIAGEGLGRLGMRFFAFQLDGAELVLRYLKTAPRRLDALERIVGRSLPGLRAPLEACPLAAEIARQREIVYREDLDLFGCFLKAATGHDVTPLDVRPSTAGICNGVIAPISVQERPWGFVSVYSPSFRASDAAAVALFATQVGSSLEVTEYVEALQVAQRELLHRERLAALGELAAIIAHEVRNPLGAMFASVAGLQRVLRSATPSAKDIEDGRLFASVLDEESVRLNSIVSDLLEFARPTSLRLDRSSLGDVVSEVASSASSRPEASSVDVRVDVEPDLPAIAMDPRLIRQAVYNLVLNGLQAMPRGGTLIMRTRQERRGDDSLACVDVIDTGVGIPGEDTSRVFEPFFTTKPTGTGLGLPLVKRVVDAHGGVLSFVSSKAGTTFTVGVPIS